MKKIIFAALALCVAMAGCQEEPSISSGLGTDAVRIDRPSGVSIQPQAIDVKVTWADNTDNETGFKVWAMNEADHTDFREMGTAPAGATETLIADVAVTLTEGKKYFFGVQSLAADEESTSSIIFSEALYTVPELETLPGAEYLGEVVSTPTCIAVSYKMVNSVAGDRYGLCWSAEGTPTIADGMAYGPDIVPPEASAPDGPYTAADKSDITQLISSIDLDYGVTYKIRPFVTTTNGGYPGTFYGPEKTVSLGTEPAAITLDWTEVADSGLPSTVKLYKTTSPVSGKPFNGWYAIADPNDVDVRVNAVAQWASNLPKTIETIASDLADDYVIVNGTYFTSTQTTGYTLVNGAELDASHIWWVAGSMGRVNTDPKYNATEAAKAYWITRATFSVNTAGDPDIFWTSTSPENGQAVTRYYDHPTLQIREEAAVYRPTSATNPCPPAEWNARYSLGAGPMLVYDGKIPFDFTSIDGGGDDSYLTNYEFIAYDIFDPSGFADRTAIGVTAEGKVILFICDGRIPSGAPGPNILELARVMKGLGCVKAMNLDGGHSTGMVAAGQRIGDPTVERTRAIRSTIGFFAKQ